MQRVTKQTDDRGDWKQQQLLIDCLKQIYLKQHNQTAINNASLYRSIKFICVASFTKKTIKSAFNKAFTALR